MGSSRPFWVSSGTPPEASWKMSAAESASVFRFALASSMPISEMSKVRLYSGWAAAKDSPIFFMSSSSSEAVQIFRVTS